jgi:hypothetical protein
MGCGNIRDGRGGWRGRGSDDVASREAAPREVATARRQGRRRWCIIDVEGGNGVSSRETASREVAMAWCQC